MNHSENDCFLLAVLSHGELGILYAKDTPYKPDNLWTPFTADKCPTLAGELFKLSTSSNKVIISVEIITHHFRKAKIIFYPSVSGGQTGFWRNFG